MKKLIPGFTFLYRVFYIIFLFSLFWSRAGFSQNFIWAKNMGGTAADLGNSIVVDGSGNIYTTGQFQGTADFDPGAGTFNLTSEGIGDIFISKLDASGNFLWAKSMGGTNNDYASTIAIDGFGNIYTTGYFKGTADFDPGIGTFTLSSAGNYDIFISKLDASGNFLWAKRIGYINDDEATAIAIGSSGNVYTTGRFTGTVDFDPGPGTFNLNAGGNSEMYACKLDALGNFVWAKSLDGTNATEGLSIALDSSENVYTTGYFFGLTDFDPGFGTFNLSSTAPNIFIFKLDASGNFVWAKSIGGVDDCRGFSIAVDNSGNVYTTGNFAGTVDFDPGTGIFNLSSGTGADLFVCKLDASGNFLWAKGIGGGSADYATGLSAALDGSGNVYITGYYWGTVDFDPGSGAFYYTSKGDLSFDIFICKLNALGNFQWAKSVGGLNNDEGLSIALDSARNVYTTGFFQETVDFDPGIGTFNLSGVGGEIFVLKLDASSTNIAEKNSNEGINIFPNPFSTQVVLQSNHFLQNVTLTLDNCFGQTVLYLENISGQNIVLNRGHLASGLYHLRLTEGNKTVMAEKLIVTDQ